MQSTKVVSLRIAMGFYENILLECEAKDITITEWFERQIATAKITEIKTFDEIVKFELKKYDQVTPAIEELKQNFLPLKIDSIDDKDGYNAVSKALRFVVNKRNLIEDKRKELKADSLTYGRAVDARAKEITAMLCPIEEHLKSEKSKIDNLLLEIEQQAEKERQAKVAERHNILINNGMELIGQEYHFRYAPLSSDDEVFYGLNDAPKLLSMNLEFMSDVDFTNFDSIINQIYKLKTEKVAQEDLKKKEADEKYEKEKKQFDEEKRKFEEDKIAQKTDMATMRMDALHSLGCEYSNMTGFIFYKGVSVTTYPEIYNMTLGDWAIAFHNIKERIIDIDNKPISVAEVGNPISAPVIESKRDDKIRNSDKEKLALYATTLLSVERPVLVSKKWISGLEIIVSDLQGWANLK